jgi:hypothetical protein
VATILKEFFRDLPEPLLPREVYHPLLAVQSKFPLKGINRSKIRLIKNNAKCRYLKKLTYHFYLSQQADDFVPNLFYRSHYLQYPAALIHNISRGHRGRMLKLFMIFTVYPVFLPYNIRRGHYLPWGTMYIFLFWLVSRSLFTLGLWAFAVIYLIIYSRTPMQVFRFLTIIKYKTIYFWVRGGLKWSIDRSCRKLFSPRVLSKSVPASSCERPTVEERLFHQRPPFSSSILPAKPAQLTEDIVRSAWTMSPAHPSVKCFFFWDLKQLFDMRPYIWGRLCLKEPWFQRFRQSFRSRRKYWNLLWE